VVQQHPPLYIELSKIFRQTDDTFISVLNNLRNNQISARHSNVKPICKPDFDLKANKGYITLTTHNNKADSMNAQALDLREISNVSTSYYRRFPDKIFPGTRTEIESRCSNYVCEKRFVL
jgi:hypothetical protein